MNLFNQKKTLSLCKTYAKVSVDQWRKSDQNTMLLKKVLQQPIMSSALAVLEQATPNEKVANDAIEITRQLGRIEGYKEAIETLRSMADFDDSEPLDVAETFAEDNLIELMRQQSEL